MRFGERVHVMGIVAHDHRLRNVYAPVLAFVLIRAFRRPDAHHDLERLEHHGAVLAVLAVHIKRQEIADVAAGADAKLEAPLRQVIEEGDPMRQLHRIVIRQQVRAGRELDPLGLQQGLRDRQIRGRVRLPGDREMLADPGLGDPQLIAPAKRLQVRLVPVVRFSLRRMGRHHEIPEIHRFTPRKGIL